MIRVPAKPLTELIAKILVGYNVTDVQALSVARNTVWNALVGRDNFSFGRLPIHIKRVQAGVLNGAAEPVVEEKIESIAIVDGCDGFGHYVGELSMAEAIRRAETSGLGVAVARNSNFFGTGAYFVNMAAEAGMVGLALSNSFPKVAAPGGALPVLGTNPFAFGVPRENGRHLLFDMATSGLAGSTVRQHIDEGTDLPVGLAVDKDGAPITDPHKVAEGALTPFGGAKGFGLSLLVEILAGVLSGAGVSNGVASLYSDFSQSGHSGHFFMAIDISKFMPKETFLERMEGLITLLHQSGSDEAVLYPGEVRWTRFEENTRLGVPLSEENQDLLTGLCEQLGVSTLWQKAT